MNEEVQDLVERGSMAVLMRAAEIPSGSTVTKRTGEEEYTIVDSIRVFNEKGKPTTIPAEGGARFLAGRAGDFNIVSPETLLLWRTDREELLDFLTLGKGEYED